MRFFVFFLCLFMFSCRNFKTNDKEIVFCSAELYDDFIVGKTVDSLIYLKNIKTDKIKMFVTKTGNCTTPILNQSSLFYLRNDNLFECINIQTNNLKWNYKSTDKITNFKIFKKFAILNIKDKGICILDLERGNVLNTIETIKHNDCNDLISDFIFDDNKLYITDFNCNNLSCINLENNELLWSVDDLDMYSTRILLSNNYIFCGMTGIPTENKGKIILVNKSDGKVVYENDELFDLIVKPILKGNKIYYVTYDEKIKVFDIENRTVKDLVNLSLINNICDNQIFLVNESLYFSNCDFDVYQYNIKDNNLKIFKKNNDYRIKNVFSLKDSIRLIF